MSGKSKDNESEKCEGKKRRIITIKNKVSIKRIDRGEKMTDIVRTHEKNHFTIATIVKNNTHSFYYIKSCNPIVNNHY